MLDFIRQHRLFQPGERLIVGVSGGADSVALLDLLVNLPGFSLQLTIAHINHCLRDAESDGDELFVRRLAEHYGIPCSVRRTDVAKVAERERLTLEEAGRAVRYSFFEELRNLQNAAAIAVAHHADDQAETLLIRLLRGGGVTGLSAMPPRNSFHIVRPLLQVTRHEIEQYLAEKRLDYRNDSSNSDHTFLRNRIRHQLIPILKGYNRSIVTQLATTASLIQDDAALLDDYVSGDFARLACSGPGWCGLELEPLRGMMSPLRSRIYRSGLKMVSGHLRGLEQRHHLLLDRLVMGGNTGAGLQLPGDLLASVTAEHLFLAEKALLDGLLFEPLRIDREGVHQLPNGITLIVRKTVAPESWQGVHPAVTYLDQDAAPFPWFVRPVEKGDRMELMWGAGSRLVHDIMIDLKIPRHLRKVVPLLFQAGSLLWLAGVRRSRHAVVRPGQKEVLELTISGLENMPLFPVKT